MFSRVIAVVVDQIRRVGFWLVALHRWLHAESDRIQVSRCYRCGYLARGAASGKGRCAPTCLSLDRAEVEVERCGECGDIRLESSGQQCEVHRPELWTAAYIAREMRVRHVSHDAAVDAVCEVVRAHLLSQCDPMVCPICTVRRGADPPSPFDYP